MTELGVGALPICGPDNKIKGVVTDRDLVRKVFGNGRDGSFPAGDLNQAEAVTIGADDSAEHVLATMTSHKVRRLPVIDGEKLVGMVSIGDVARSLPEHAGRRARRRAQPTEIPVLPPARIRAGGVSMPTSRTNSSARASVVSRASSVSPAG